MQQYRPKDVLRTRLDQKYPSVPISHIREAGPDIFHLTLSDESNYSTPEEVFGEDYTAGIELSETFRMKIIHIGYTPEKIRYFEVKVEDDTNEYL